MEGPQLSEGWDMGLDQYLHRSKYIGRWEHQKETQPEEYNTATKIIKLAGMEEAFDEPNTFVTVTTTVAYWRKANQIHNWFVENVQGGVDNCQPFPVSRDQLTELKRQVDLVLGNPDFGPDVLPTTSGFFFGSTEYDEWYMSDLKYTSKRLGELLANDTGEWGHDYEYQSSW